MDIVSNISFKDAAVTEFDDSIVALSKELEDLGIENNSIVIISSDNGANQFSLPNMSKSGKVIKNIFHHMDWIPAFMTALSEPNLKDKLKIGYKSDGKTFKVHQNGYNQLPLLQGEWPGSRKTIKYTSDNSNYSTYICNKWKISFLIQESNGFDVWDVHYGSPQVN